MVFFYSAKFAGFPLGTKSWYETHRAACTVISFLRWDQRTTIPRLRYDILSALSLREWAFWKMGAHPFSHFDARLFPDFFSRAHIKRAWREIFFLANIQREWACHAFRRQNPLTFAKPGNVARARIRIDTPVCRLGGNATRNSNAVRSRGPYPILPPIGDPQKKKQRKNELLPLGSQRSYRLAFGKTGAAQNWISKRCCYSNQQIS